MRPYDPQQPIIYTHIPKCAGTSVVRLLRRWFGKTYHKLNQDETQDIVLPRVKVKTDSGQWREDVSCIHGHFNNSRGYGLPDFYPDVNQYFTILRDPFDLVVSMYFFAKGRSMRGEFWFRGEQVDIRDEYPTVSSYVSSHPYWLFDHLPRDVTLTNFREKLESRFVYIGLFEDLQTTVDMLAEVFEKPPTVLEKFNVSTYDEPVPAHLRRQFYNDYPLLKLIHEFASENYKKHPTRIAGSNTPANNRGRGDQGSSSTAVPAGNKKSGRDHSPA